LVELWRIKARRVDEFLACEVVQQHIPALAGVGFVPRREGDQRAVGIHRRMKLGAGRVVELRRRYELFLRYVEYEDLAGLVFQLGGEDTEFAVLRKNGMVVLAIRNRRNVADDLPLRDAVVLVEVDLRMLGAIAVGGEGDEEAFGRLVGRLLR